MSDLNWTTIEPALDGRPFFRLGIAELEELAAQGTVNQVLGVARELQHRTRSRAVKLRERMPDLIHAAAHRHLVISWLMP